MALARSTKATVSFMSSCARNGSQRLASFVGSKKSSSIASGCCSSFFIAQDKHDEQDKHDK